MNVVEKGSEDPFRKLLLLLLLLRERKRNKSRRARLVPKCERSYFFWPSRRFGQKIYIYLPILINRSASRVLLLART